MHIVELSILSQQGQEIVTDFLQAKQIANELLAYSNRKDVSDKIRIANAPGNSSHDIQEIFLEFLSQNGFQDEKKGLFSNYRTPLLRPDYYKPLDNTGIIFEVERGKIIMNNMDMLDLWKCHICPYADYLFLAVPKVLKQNNQSRGTNSYETVQRRLGTFFEPQNYTNVKAVFIFGY